MADEFTPAAFAACLPREPISRDEWKRKWKETVTIPERKEYLEQLWQRAQEKEKRRLEAGGEPRGRMIAGFFGTVHEDEDAILFLEEFNSIFKIEEPGCRVPYLEWFHSKLQREYAAEGRYIAREQQQLLQDGDNILQSMSRLSEKIRADSQAPSLEEELRGMEEEFERCRARERELAEWGKLLMADEEMDRLPTIGADDHVDRYLRIIHAQVLWETNAELALMWIQYKESLRPFPDHNDTE